MAFDNQYYGTSGSGLVDTGMIDDPLSITEMSSNFYNFLNTFHVDNVYPYREQITSRVNNGENFMEISLDDFQIADPISQGRFQQMPSVYLKAFEDAACKLCKVFCNTEIISVQLLYTSTQSFTNIRDICATHVNKLVRVPGIVISASRSRAYCRRLIYRCSRCNTTGSAIEVGPMRKASVPRECPRVGDASKEPCPKDCNYIVSNQCGYVNQQTLKLQECPEDVHTGEMPRHIVCMMERNLVDRIAPGTRCSLIGYVDTFDQQKQRMVDTVALKVSYIRVLGVHVEETGIGRAMSSFTPAQEEEFNALAHNPNIYDLIVRNIAPSITGDYTVDIKKAIACQLFSGSRKILPDNTRLRGDINVLLMGDPSTAKSQFLKFVEKVAPVGVYTSGKGSSAAGLTASVIQDAKGEFYLEGGAMVLADGGVVCIDEFDKMRETDRVAIHEAMEQQTISIAKAGITTVLNSRCSVLAAANPIFGRYDDTRTTSENIDFLPSILSRFDLIFIVRDIRDYNRDVQMAQNVVGTHMRAGKEASMGSDEMPLEKMKKFIAYCRAKCAPRLSQKAGETLQSRYVEMREEIHKQSMIDGNNPPVPISVRQLEAIIRIAESLAKMRLSPEANEDDVNEALRLFKLSTLDAARNGVVGEAMNADMKKQVDLIENLVKSRVAIGSQISRSRVVNSLRSSGYSPFAIDRALAALTRKREFDEKDKGRLLIRLRFDYLMSSVENVKMKAADGLMNVVDISRTNCLVKGIVSAVAGIGMGASFGIFMGTFEGCHGDLPGKTMSEQLKFACKQTVACTWRRCVSYGGSFGMIGFILTSGSCYLARLRGKDDQLNSTISGAVAGGAWGMYAGRNLPFPRMVWKSFKFAFGFVAFGWVIDYVMNSFQERASWTRAFTTKHSI